MPRLSKENWLEEGLIYLVENGVDALTIDAMCQHLNVTKGSFYHHFKNHRAFLNDILEFWETTYTVKFIEHSIQGKTPMERIQRLNDLVVEAHGPQETAIRAWAQTDPVAREVHQRVDQRRIDYLYELHRELYDEHTARIMARLLYATLIGAQSMLPPATKDELSDMFAILSHLMVNLMEDDNGD